MKNLFLKQLLIVCLVFLGFKSSQGQIYPRPSRLDGPPPQSRDFRADRPAPRNQEERMERLETAKIAFLTQRIGLTSREAEKFWPVYNQYQNELKTLIQQRKGDLQKQNQLPATDKIDMQLDMESKVLELKKRYTREFAKVLPPEKIVKLFQAERDFKNELIRELRERKQ
jgi:hypothetical protein